MLVVKLNGINFRLGNLIFIIIRVIATNFIYYKHNKIIIKDIKNRNNIVLSKFLDYYCFDEYNDNKNNNNIIESDFFDDTYYNQLSIDVKEAIINKFVKPYIDYEINNIFNIDFTNDLIIHIRSGDVFDRNDKFVNEDVNSFAFRIFIQPPYSFYEKIINNNKYIHIYIISENNNNPIIQKLINNYNNITFLNNDIDMDFKILLNCKNLVTSNSDFVLSSIFLSKEKNILYCSKPDYLKDVKHKFNIITYDYTEYYNSKIDSYDAKIHLMLNS